MIRPWQALLLIVTGLLVLGIIAVQSAGLSVGRDQAATLPGLLLDRTTLLGILALLALLCGMYTPVDRLSPPRCQWIPTVLLVAAVVLLVLVQIPGIGREVHGARRWIDIGPIGFQPSEVAKWALVLFLAWHVVARADRLGEFKRGFLPGAAIILFIGALIGIEDLGTSVVIVIVGMAILIAGGCRLSHALLPIPFAAAAIVAALFASPYRLDRLRAFLDPYADPEGIGYHVLQSMSAISGGGLAGRGLGNGVQKFGYLPEDTTDFLFSVICEELGLVGCLLIVALYMGLLLAGLRIMLNTTRPFYRLLAFGILLMITVQALVNLAVVTGMAPTKGIALPLLSSGGTGWLLMGFCIGLLASIDRVSGRSTPEKAWHGQPVTT
ncbi:MAG: FtsW/RodA/SpoVE family cell cycle protein [Phycisphaerales bacterium]|nr:FtsW/RodA/SpoVE family cell cycle protein [Phycisphaerales bacterium]